MFMEDDGGGMSLGNYEWRFSGQTYENESSGFSLYTVCI